MYSFPRIFLTAVSSVVWLSSDAAQADLVYILERADSPFVTAEAQLEYQDSSGAAGDRIEVRAEAYLDSSSLLVTTEGNNDRHEFSGPNSSLSVAELSYETRVEYYSGIDDEFGSRLQGVEARTSLYHSFSVSARDSDDSDIAIRPEDAEFYQLQNIELSGLISFDSDFADSFAFVSLPQSAPLTLEGPGVISFTQILPGFVDGEAVDYSIGFDFYTSNLGIGDVPAEQFNSASFNFDAFISLTDQPVTSSIPEPTLAAAYLLISGVLCLTSSRRRE